MLSKIRSWFSRSKMVRNDMYREGQDYMIRLLNKYPEPLAFEQAMKVPRDYSNPFDRGVIDYCNEYKAIQRGELPNG